MPPQLEVLLPEDKSPRIMSDESKGDSTPKRLPKLSNRRLLSSMSLYQAAGTPLPFGGTSYRVVNKVDEKRL